MDRSDVQLKRYYYSIKRELPCSRKMKKQIMKQIQDNVLLFLEQNPTADIEAVHVHFGTAQEIASSYIEAQDVPGLLRTMHIKKKIIVGVACIMVAVLLIWGAVVTWALIDNATTDNGYFKVVVTED